ncbi:MAG: putative DNA binding domain-containing protein [Desulfamplus sp.]|nr:putative DNA binding domain-containing protein [Desulfamplus sp.]
MAESNRIEYKQQLTDSLEKEVVAFLNYPDGGIIYIGVNDDGSPCGIPNVDKVQLAIKDRLKHNISPSALGLFDVIHEDRDGKDLIKIIVASGSEKPYHLRKYGMSEKGCFIRIGSASEPMPTRMIEDLFSQRTRNSLSRIRSIRQDLSFEQLKIYYQEAGLTLNDKFAANLELLTEDGFYNYNGYLMADQNGNTVQVAKYAGTDRVDLLESKDYGFCCLIKSCKLILDRLEAVENRVINQITSRERINRSYWDTVALREAVINAIIHNDYATELVPKFEIFTDRLEITSAASIHPGQEQEYFFSGYSMPRNKAIMRVFKDLGMVEFLGSGMPRILKAYPRESFTFSNYFVRAVFPISTEALALEEEVKRETTGEDDAGTPIGGAMGGVIGGAIELPQRQKEVLDIIKTNPKVSYRVIADILSINQSAVSKHVTALKKKGFLKRIGGTRGHWTISLGENNDI